MATVTAHRSAYGLDSYPDEGWRQRAACRHTPDSHIIVSRSEAPQARAGHVCKQHCPVLAPCLADALSAPDRVGGTVQGGFAWLESRRLGVRQMRLRDPGHGAHCAHLLGRLS